MNVILLNRTFPDFLMLGVIQRVYLDPIQKTFVYRLLLNGSYRILDTSCPWPLSTPGASRPHVLMYMAHT